MQLKRERRSVARSGRERACGQPGTRLRADPERVEDLLQGETGPEPGEQRLAALGDVEPDGHCSGDAAANLFRSQGRRDHTDERLRRATGVEYVAGSHDTDPDPRAEVVVPGDCEGGAP